MTTQERVRGPLCLLREGCNHSWTPYTPVLPRDRLSASYHSKEGQSLAANGPRKGR